MSIRRPMTLLPALLAAAALAAAPRTAEAQFGRRLKDAIKHTAEDKAIQKTTETENKAIDSALSGSNGGDGRSGPRRRAQAGRGGLGQLRLQAGRPHPLRLRLQRRRGGRFSQEYGVQVGGVGDGRVAGRALAQGQPGLQVLRSGKYGTIPDCPGVVAAALTRQGVVPSSLQLSGVRTQVWSQVPPLNSRRPRPWNRPGHEGASLCRWQMRVGVPVPKIKILA